MHVPDPRYARVGHVFFTGVLHLLQQQHAFRAMSSPSAVVHPHAAQWFASGSAAACPQPWCSVIALTSVAAAGHLTKTT